MDGIKKTKTVVGLFLPFMYLKNHLKEAAVDLFQKKE